MTRRWFFSFVRQGVAAGISANASVKPEVKFARHVGGAARPNEVASGPAMRLTSADDVDTIAAGLVWREEPPPGTPAAAENVMASVEFAHADLPWLLSTRSIRPPNGADEQPLPWLVLLVVSATEAGPPRDADPAPILTVPLSALPPLDESWAWAHVEARLPDTSDLAAATAAVAGSARTRSGTVVARLLSPRKLTPDTEWIAAVVPVPSSGAWPAPAAGTNAIEVRVFHWWRFRTGQSGSFEDLARRLKKADGHDLGLGARSVDVSTPFPGDVRSLEMAASVDLDGALRAPGPSRPETWTDADAQAAFRERMTTLLNAPAALRETPADDEPVDGGVDGGPLDRDELAVGPPLYGSHHTGEQTIAGVGDGWLTTLNLDVSRRVPASLGTRYVQLEQEFLMARAWEQVGEIREANRALAAAELAVVASQAARRKHVEPQGAVDLVTTMAPMAPRLTMPMAFMNTGAELAPDASDVATLSAVIATSDVPTGMTTTAYSRLTRSTGALARRAERIEGGALDRAQLTEDLLRIETTARPGLVGGEERATLVDVITSRTDPLILQLRRMADVVGAAEIATRGVADDRPLAPIMRHPQFGVAIGEELLARWPEWALPGIGSVPDESVIVLETNPAFVASLLVGLNHEFNRELLWREFPTDQRGTPFRRFWPTPGDDVDEIGRWPLDSELGSQIASGAEGSIVLMIRGEVLRRFPATALIAIKGENGRVPMTLDAGIHGLPMPLDDSTTLFLFSAVSEERAIAEDWLFVLREPMRATQFGFDLQVRNPDGTIAADQARLSSWADLTWARLTLDGAGYVRVQPAPPNPVPGPGDPAPVDPPKWGAESADMARIAFQQPFQLAFRARDWLG